MAVYFRSVPASTPFTFESLGCGWTQVRVSRPAGFPHYHYLQTEKGEGAVRCGGRTYLLREDEGMLLAPSVPHSYEKTSGLWITRFASFSGTMVQNIPQLLGGRKIILIEKEQGRSIASLIDACMKICTSHPLDEKTFSIQCYSLLMSFTGVLHSQSLSDEPLYRSYVEPVIKEIEKHYAEDLTAAYLSSMVYITPQYLSRLFRRFLSCSTYEYLTAFRISRAKELLVTSPGTEIKDVAHRTGFADSSHFIAVFRKMTGFTPLEFRRMN